MYDFRQKRRSRAAVSRPVVRSKKLRVESVVSGHKKQPQSVQRRTTRYSSSTNKTQKNEPFVWRFFSTVITVLVGILIIAVCVYFFVTRIASSLWPLGTVQTILLVPETTTQQPLSFIQVLVLDPYSHTVQVAQLPSDVALTTFGEMTIADLKNEIVSPSASSSGVLSMKLGRVIDQVVIVPDSEPLRTHSDAKRTFQALIRQETPKHSSFEKIQWWLFIVSMSDADFRIKTVQNFSAWQAWLASMTKQAEAQCSLALINTTPTSGLSRFISQVMEQSGYQVIKVESQPKFLQKSQLFLSPERLQCLGAVERLQNFLPERIEVVQDLAATQQARADIVWLLGSDVAGQAGQVMGK